MSCSKVATLKFYRPICSQCTLSLPPENIRIPYSSLSENLTVFWCFQGVKKGCIGNNWVNVMFTTSGWFWWKKPKKGYNFFFFYFSDLSQPAFLFENPIHWDLEIAVCPVFVKSALDIFTVCSLVPNMNLSHTQQLCIYAQKIKITREGWFKVFP